MPKHVPTFKHLINTSHTRRDESTSRDRGERTVNDRLNSSRARQHAISRESTTLLAAATEGERIWSVTDGGGVPIVGDAGVHPAELLRRTQVAQRQASRSAPGPAPPLSWRPAVSGKYQQKSTRPELERLITVNDLRRSAEMFARPIAVGSTTIGPARLVEQCLTAIMAALASDNQIAMEEGGGTAVLGDVMRDQVGYLAPHLKAGLLETNSFLLKENDNRLSDKSLRAILNDPEEDEVNDWEGESGTSDGAEWEVSTASLHYLPLTLHPSPTAFLRHIPSFSIMALSSLNLAYSTLGDLDRLLAVLPSSLRELSLCGVKLKGGEGRLVDGDAWRRALGAMGRKLIVLTVLDLSQPPLPLSPLTMSTLLHPPDSRLPSLRLLGLRDVLQDENGVVASGSGNDQGNGAIDTAAYKKRLTEIIRGDNRQRYIDIRWS